MTTASGTDLTDTWHGRFTYPAGRGQPTSFVARLDHSGTWLSGTIEERGSRRVEERTMTATLSGQVLGDAVTFMKVYDAKLGGYDKVFYEGVLRDEGLRHLDNPRGRLRHVPDDPLARPRPGRRAQARRGGVSVPRRL